MKFTKEQLKEAHEKSRFNRDEVLESSCGCFHCGKLFSGVRVSDWVDDQHTALCPFCGIDSVIPYTEDPQLLSHSFLQAMKEYWFGQEDKNE